MDYIRRSCLFLIHRPVIVMAIMLTMQGMNSFAMASALADKNQCATIYSKNIPKNELLEISLTIEKYKRLLKLSEIGDKPIHLDQVKDLFSKLSEKKKIKILKLITNAYLDIKTFKYDRTLPVKKLKRHFDVILSESGEAFEFFNSTVVNHLYPIEKALQLFYKIEAKRVGISKPMDVENLLYTAYKIQDTFKDEANYVNEKIYLYGSFVNGRGVSELSDLDFAISNALLSAKVESLKLNFSELDQFRLSEAQAHMASKNKIHQYGYINPIVVVVHQNAIEIRVYKSKKFNESQKDPFFLSFYI